MSTPNAPKPIRRVNIKRNLKRAALLPRSLYLQRIESERLNRARGRKKIYYLMSLNENHPNLGDQAQRVAIREWLARHFADFEVFEFRCHERFDFLPLIQHAITDEDLVMLHSGGNFGDTWPVTEGIRQDIIRALPGRPMLQLPQTIDFSDEPAGRRMLAAAQSAIGAHGKLILTGRDLRSAELAAAYFPQATVRPFPDMVLSLAGQYRARYPRPDVGSAKRLLMIMRNDKEGVFAATDIARIRAQFSDREVVVWDTDVREKFPRDKAKATIEKYFDYIASFDHVLTDRYHGLIFSVLTNRPAVVLATVNHKLSSAASWFAELPTVRFASSSEVVRKELDLAVHAVSAGLHDWEKIHFKPMADMVKAKFVIQR
jgi:exopolysaccharide biosynthesis predicted pyruvyltransferase EpsI